MTQQSSPALGITNGKLAPCPDSPNCVSSQSNDSANSIEPLRYSDTQTEAKDRLLGIIESLPRTQIQKNEEHYVHVIFTSLLFRFADDVEFYFSEKEKLIHVRSASRVGYSDLGANRKRVEDIRIKFNR